jgi:transcription elongation factor Elf1
MSPSADQSHLDRKYFIDHRTYNCPFCNRRHVSCRVTAADRFDWSNSKACYVYLVKCESCGKESMHLSYALLTEFLGSWGHQSDVAFKRGIDLDALIFYSVPTSFFVMDDRIPAIIRELITEAEGCRKMNFLTGASACARKTIYEFLVEQKAEGDSYEDRIKSLKVSVITRMGPRLLRSIPP